MAGDVAVMKTKCQSKCPGLMSIRLSTLGERENLICVLCWVKVTLIQIKIGLNWYL